MRIKLSAEDARWSAREAAWGFEERVLWRASDTTRSAIRRAMRATAPLQRLIQTRLVWPISDRLQDYGTGTRTALATVGVLAALGAGTAGAMVAGSDNPSGPGAAPALAAVPTGETGASLQGVTPDFVSDPNAAATTTTQAKAAPPPEPGELGPDATADQVAWRFAQAFVLYEVGKVDKEAADTFRTAATPPLAKALKDHPPRLPEGKKVPEAKVLNVVLGKETGKEMTASISLVRLQAASELRLTLRDTKKGWRVAGVLG